MVDQAEVARHAPAKLRIVTCLNCGVTVQRWSIVVPKYCGKPCYFQHRRKQMDELVRKGFCEDCGLKKLEPAVPGKKYCVKHLEMYHTRTGKGRFDASKFHCIKCLKREALKPDVMCPECAQGKNSFKNRVKVLELFGSKCADCGFTSPVKEVFDLHHLNPSTKDPGWDKMYRYSWARVLTEIRKGVVLLCANCHRIRHALAREGEKVHVPVAKIPLEV